MMKRIIELIFALLITIGLQAQTKSGITPNIITRIAMIKNATPTELGKVCAVLETQLWTIADRVDDPNNSEMEIVACKKMSYDYGNFNIQGNPHNALRIHFIKEGSFRPDEIYIIFNDLYDMKAFFRQLTMEGYDGNEDAVNKLVELPDGSKVTVDVTFTKDQFMPNATIKFS